MFHKAEKVSTLYPTTNKIILLCGARTLDMSGALNSKFDVKKLIQKSHETALINVRQMGGFWNNRNEY